MPGYRQLLYAGLVAAVALVLSLSWYWIYSNAFLVDFSEVIPISAVVAATVFGTTLLCTVWFFAGKSGKRVAGWLNVLILAVSFLSILPCFMVTLPLGVKHTELFPGMVVPMHFFPVMAFWALLPFFESK